MQKCQEISARLCKSGPVSDAGGDKATILQNHGEIKEQQSLTLTGTRCCFLCSGVFGCLARPDVSPLPLPSCCCVLCKSKVRPPGPAAHPLPPARPHSFGPLLTSQKTGIFRKKISPARKYFNLAHWARQHWLLRSLGTFVSERFPDRSSRRRNKCDLPEISPRVSPPPPKQNSQQLSTALGLTVGECQRDFAKKSRGKVRSCL